MGKTFEKQAKTIENQRSEISVINGSGKQIFKCNEVAKSDFNIYRSGVPHGKQKEIFNKLVNERALQFVDIKDKIDPNNLVYKFSGNENKPKDFGNC